MPLPPFLRIRPTPLLAAVAVLCGIAASPSRAANDPILFRRDVMAVLSKAGCNAGGCHGNATGKGGFKLSLRGQDPDLDWQALTRDQAGRRVNLIQPENSLILLKPTAMLAHEGGQRFGANSPEYAILLRWLRDGAKDSGVNAPKLTKLDVKIPNHVIIEPATDVKLHVTAKFADGSERDVTRFAVYEPNNQLVKVSVDGLVTRDQSGETTVLVRYLNKQVAVPIAFIPARPDFVWSNPPANNYIDEQVYKKLRILRMNPSDLCTDAIFIRRAYLDLLGFVPDAKSAQAFIADPAPDKRAKLIDSLLERPEYADFWSLKWADLLKIEQRQLDYDGMQVFHDWIRESIAKNKPLDQFAKEIIAARGSTLKNPPANWWRANRDPVTRAENTARVFLGLQLKCAQCHNHPFERWTQDDYYNWADLFARIDYKLSADKRGDKNDKNEFKGDQTVLIKPKAVFLNLRTGDPARPRFLGVTEPPPVSKDHDELLALADWLPHTPTFARMQVNRVWFNLLGRGIVDPVDDFRASNPPAHPELLDALAKDFATHGYDLHWLIRTITASRVYQLSAVPNATNAADETNNSHALVRRLSAEQMLDSLSAVLATPLPLENAPPGVTRVSQIAEGRKHYKPLTTEIDRFEASFGKPPRLIASDCERSNDTALPQVFELVSGPLIQQLLTRKDNVLGKLLEAEKDDAKVVDQLFWTVLTRAPTAAEAERCTALAPPRPKMHANGLNHFSRPASECSDLRAHDPPPPLEKSKPMNRREAIQRISSILGGVLSAQLTAGLMGQVINPGASVTVDAGQLALLAEVADTIIPTTDTPGAKAAGAEQFIVRVMRDCYLWEEQTKFYAGLDRLDRASKAALGKGFATLDAAAKNEMLKKFAGTNKAFFTLMKQLTVAGYFTSEIGATKALAYLPIPGRFDGEVAMTPGQKTWAL